MSSTDISSMNIFDIQINEYDYMNTICHDRILILTKEILSNEDYYLRCIQYCYRYKLDYDDFDFNQIRLLNSLYSSDIVDSIYTYDSTIKNEEYLRNFLDELNKFFKFVLNHYTETQIEYILDLGIFVGDTCPYDECGNFIFGYHKKCDSCDRNVILRCNLICSVNDNIYYKSDYDLEDVLYYVQDIST